MPAHAPWQALLARCHGRQVVTVALPALPGVGGPRDGQRCDAQGRRGQGRQRHDDGHDPASVEGQLRRREEDDRRQRRSPLQRRTRDRLSAATAGRQASSEDGEDVDEPGGITQRRAPQHRVQGVGVHLRNGHAGPAVEGRTKHLSCRACRRAFGRFGRSWSPGRSCRSPRSCPGTPRSRRRRRGGRVPTLAGWFRAVRGSRSTSCSCSPPVPRRVEMPSAAARPAGPGRLAGRCPQP